MQLKTVRGSIIAYFAYSVMSNKMKMRKENTTKIIFKHITHLIIEKRLVSFFV